MSEATICVCSPRPSKHLATLLFVEDTLQKRPRGILRRRYENAIKVNLTMTVKTI
jgi:hypothetical protein